MSDAKDVLGLVPEAYFDLIARIVPGIIAVIVIAINPSIKEEIASYEIVVGKAGLFFVIFLLSYAVGLVFDVTGELISDFVIRVINIKRLNKMDDGAKFCDQLKNLKPDDARIIIKMMAERVAFRSLFLLTILTIILLSLFTAVKLPLLAKCILPLIFMLALLQMEFSVRKRLASINKCITNKTTRPPSSAGDLVVPE